MSDSRRVSPYEKFKDPVTGETLYKPRQSKSKPFEYGERLRHYLQHTVLLTISYEIDQDHQSDMDNISKAVDRMIDRCGLKITS